MLRKFLRIFSTREPSLLGRWNLTDMTQNKIKIDWANVDHCGTCSYKQVKERINEKKMENRSLEVTKKSKID
jgi:hypothetical protein